MGGCKEQALTRKRGCIPGLEQNERRNLQNWLNEIRVTGMVSACSSTVVQTNSFLVTGQSGAWFFITTHLTPHFSGNCLPRARIQEQAAD